MSKNTKKPHYIYKVAATTETGGQLADFIKKCDEVSETARAWAEAHGALSYFESPSGMAGGVAALEFAEGKVPKDWEELTAVNGSKLYMPPYGSDEEQEMYALPIVSEAALIGILKFKHVNDKKTNLPLPYTFGEWTPILFRRGDYWYVDVPYESESADCVKITADELHEKMKEIS